MVSRELFEQIESNVILLSMMIGFLILISVLGVIIVMLSTNIIISIEQLINFIKPSKPTKLVKLTKLTKSIESTKSTKQIYTICQLINEQEDQLEEAYKNLTETEKTKLLNNYLLRKIEYFSKDPDKKKKQEKECILHELWFIR